MALLPRLGSFFFERSGSRLNLSTLFTSPAEEAGREVDHTSLHNHHKKTNLSSSSDGSPNSLPKQSEEQTQEGVPNGPVSLHSTTQENLSHIEDPDSYPDGGLRAWLTVVGAFFGLFASFGWINAAGVFQAYYQAHQLSQFPPSTVAWIASLEVYAMFFGGPIVGWLYDRYGPQYLLLAGAFMHVFGLLMASVSKKYFQFLLSQGVCSSIGASLIFYPSTSAIPSWFYRRRALTLGIAAAGSSLGGVIFPIMIHELLPQIGFGWTMRTAALLIFVLVIIANLLVRSRIKPVSRPWSVLQHIEPLYESGFRWFLLGSFLYFLGLFLPFTFNILHARRIGMSAELAAYMPTILNGVSLFGRIIPGWMGDRFGRFNVTVTMCLLSGLVDLAIWLPSRSNASVIAFAALYGFTSGAFVSMVPALVAQITPDVRTIGVRTGTLFFIMSFSVLIGNPIGGVLVSRWNGEYTGLQIFCGVCQLAGGCFLLVARVTTGGKQWRSKV